MSHTDREEVAETPRNSIREQIGALIYERREARGLGRTELGRLLEDAKAPSRWQSYKGVWALESGKASIRLEDLQVLADVLGDPVELYLTPLLPAGVAISPEEAHERIGLAYREFLDRAARRVEEAVSGTMDEPEFRQTIAWLAELSRHRRQMVREVIRGLRRNEQEDRYVAKPRAVVPDMRQVGEPLLPEVDLEAQLREEDLERASTIGQARAHLRGMDPEYQEFVRWQSSQRTQTSKGGSKKE